MFGGLVGAAFLLLAPPLARVALAFGPVEYFWLAVFGLTLIASPSEGSLLKGLIGNARGEPIAEFFTRPIAMGIIAFIVLGLRYPLLTTRLRAGRSVDE